MQTTSERLASWLIRRRWLVLALAGALAVVAGYRTVLTYAALQSDLEELLPKTAPSVVALSTVRQRLPGLRHLGVVVDTGGAHNVAAAEHFIDALASRVRKYPPELVGAVRTDLATERRFGETYAFQLMEPADIRKLREAVEKRRDWEVTREMGIDLLDESESPPPKLPIDELRDKYQARYGRGQGPSSDRFVSRDKRTVVLLVQASSHTTSYDADKELLSRVKQDVAALGFPDAFAKGMRVGYAGDVATRVEETEGLVADLSVSGVLVFLLVVGVIVGFYRSWRALPILGVPLACGTLFAFGIVALPPLSIRHLNSNTAFLGSIVVGNGINSGIMLLARVQEERRGGSPLETAIGTALRTTWRPTLAAATAAAAAYGSLVFTDFRGFNQFGWIGGFGMILCWGATMLLVPPMAALIGERMAVPSRERVSRRGLFQRLLAHFLGHPRAVLAVTVALAALAVAGVVHRSGSWFEYDFSKLRRRAAAGTGERYWGKRMDDTLGRYLTPTVVMADDAKQARIIEERVRKLKRDGGAGGLIASVRSAHDILPGTRRAAIEEARKLRKVMTPHMRGELSARDREMVDRALSDKAMQPLAATELPDALVAGLREYDGRIDREVLVFPELSEGTWDAGRMAAFTRDLRKAATVDEHPVPVAGSLLLSSDIVSAMKADGPRTTALSLAAVLAICVLSFRSVTLSLFAVASLFVGVAVMLGTMAWSGQRLNFSNFVTLPITFGIAADYSINMLKRYQSEGRLGLEAALAATGGAVALCSATTIIGFGSLLVAQNQALFSFGVFAVAGEIACLATAVIALPAVITLVTARRSGANLAAK